MKTIKVVFNIEDEYVAKLKNRKKDLNSVFSRGYNYDSFGENEYVYNTDIEDLEVGDRLVAQVRDTYSIVTFIRYVGDSSIKHPIKKIVDKIDFTTYMKSVERERRVALLKEKMESRKEKLDEMRVFSLMAEEDEDMKDMLKEYKDLMGE